MPLIRNTSFVDKATTRLSDNDKPKQIKGPLVSIILLVSLVFVQFDYGAKQTNQYLAKRFVAPDGSRSSTRNASSSHKYQALYAQMQQDRIELLEQYAKNTAYHCNCVGAPNKPRVPISHLVSNASFFQQCQPAAPKPTTWIQDIPPGLLDQDSFTTANPLPNISIPSHFTFVHVGKTAGSTIACTLDVAKARTPTCTTKTPSTSLLNSRTKCRVHIGSEFGSGCRALDQGYLVTLRNPINRFLSYFQYEHIEDHTNLKPSTKKTTCTRMIFNACFRKIEYLTMFGLTEKGRQTTSTFQNATTLQLTDEVCRDYAWNVIKGYWGANIHNKYNYENYYQVVQAKQRQQKQECQGKNATVSLLCNIYVLRTEFLWQDYSKLDMLLGGNGSLPVGSPLHLNPSSGGNNANSNSSGMPQDSFTNLCRSLCREIHFYQKFLLAAINLSWEEKRTSWNEVLDMCPSWTLSNCP